MLEDNGVIADERGASAKAASVEPEIGPARTLSSHTSEEPKTLDCADVALDPPTETIDLPVSLDGAPPPSIHVGNSSARITMEQTRLQVSPSAITPPVSQQAPNAALEESKWENRRILSKRWAETGCEYKVRWKDI